MASNAIKLTILLILTICSHCYSQDDSVQNSTTEPRIFHISASSNYDSDSANFDYKTVQLNGAKDSILVMSIYDSDSSIVKNWDDFISTYSDRNCLIVVSTKNDGCKKDFISLFYRQILEKSLLESYEFCIDTFSSTCPNLRYNLFIR